MLLFPSAYQLASTLLTEDAIVTVKGRLSRSKDQPELHGQEVSVPDLADGPSGPVVITMPSTRCTMPVVEQLKDVLGTHPGVTEVRLRLMTKTSTTVMKLDDRLRVAAEPGPVRRPQGAARAALPGRLMTGRPGCRVDRAQPPRREPAAGRGARRVVLGVLLVLGVLCGVLWWLLVDPAAYTKTARRRRDGGGRT